MLCEEANVDPWSTAYKICMSKFKNKTQNPKNASFKKNIVETLFPKYHPITCAKPRTEVVEPPLLVSEDEVLAIAGKIIISKAPGIDGIPNRAFKEAMILKPNVFAKMYNEA